MTSYFVTSHFPKQRSVALTALVGLALTLLYLLSNSTDASGATVSTSGGSCAQSVGSNTGVSVAVVNGNCVITFTNVGTTTWTVPAGVGSVRSLVVGGGGGNGSGGCNWMYSRGGGGGGVVDTAATAVTAGSTVSITVGGGGAAGVDRDCNGPAGQISAGTQGGSSQFASNSTVSGGYSSPVSTSAGGASGGGYAGSGGNNAATLMSSYAGGGGGGAGGAGGQESGGNNTWAFSDKAGKGGIGIFSDITGSSIGHGGGGAGYAQSGAASATSGGGSSASAVNSGGSYGGGGSAINLASVSSNGGAGVVIISYIPVAARLIGNGGAIKTFSPTDSICSGGMRGLTSDGTYVYFRTASSVSNICIANLATGAFVRAQAVSGSSLSGVPPEQNALTFSAGCIFVRNSISGGSTLNCIDTSTWIMSAPITPTGGSIPSGGGWLSGNLMNFPDGRVGAVAAPSSTSGSGGAASGANQCPTGNYCKILRTFTVSRNSGTAVLTFSEDFTLVDPVSGWPSDDHGMATDGTYLYEIMHNNGYKVWALKSGTPSPIIFNGAGTGTCTAPSGISGSMCPIYQTVTPGVDAFGSSNAENATFFGRSHLTNQYLMGAYSANKFWVSDAVAPPLGPGSSTVPDAPTIATATQTGNSTATVAFTAPTYGGSSAITSYTATSSPAGGTGTLSQAGPGTITVSGLTSNTAYTFTVTATNTQGPSLPSSPSNSITTTSIASIAVPESTLVALSSTTNITGLTIGGLAAGTTYLIAIGITNAPTGASLKLPSTTGLTASYGYTTAPNTFSSFTNISFTGLIADINTAIASMQYLSGATSGSPTIKITASSSNSSYALNGYNGHFYVANSTLGLPDNNYTAARAAAKLQTYRGLSGYLTTITSSGENTFVSNNISNASSVWIGATDELSKPTFLWDTSGGSPEAGTAFCSGLGTCAPINSAFTSFASGEPNNYGGGEAYLVTNWTGSLGFWNDCDNLACRSGGVQTAAYVIEFGTNAADGGFVNSSSDLASSTFTLFYSTSAQIPSVILVDPQASSIYLPSTLNTAGPTYLLLCFNETNVSGTNVGSPAINFDVGGQGVTSGSLNSATISGGRSTAAYIYGAIANVIGAANTAAGTQLYLSSGTFNSSVGASRYIRLRAISIASSSSLGSKTCSSTPYTSQIVEIRPLGLTRVMKKGTISLRP